MMRYQPIYDIAEICSQKNIGQAVLCPGSRCAPLTLAFTRHPGIKTKTFTDERSAGFIALGMAQSTRCPIAIVCTSGTAAYNLAPAVAEAFFSQTPLVIFTADRPAEWIGQQDGQTIFQNEIFGRHVKKYFQLPQDYEHPDSRWAINRIVNEAVNLATQFPAGPVHINAPFREPLYPANAKEPFSFDTQVRIMAQHISDTGLSDDAAKKIARSWPSFHNVLLVAGQHFSDAGTIRSVQTIETTHQVPVVSDIIANLHEVENAIRHSDLFLGQSSENLKELLQPDLLITFGNALISKNLKLFLRRYPAKAHWHIQPSGPVADTFKTLTDIFYTTPERFLSFLANLNPRERFDSQKQKNYYNLWQVEERRVTRVLDEFMNSGELHELGMVKALLDNLPNNTNLHLANSMSVRYANFIGLQAHTKGIEVFSNRGTSGIDGSTSTAVGHVLASERQNFLITGDLAFFYDRNAFWHNYAMPNLRILLLNNHGGLIFDILEGPASTPEAAEYFITRQNLNGLKLCEEYGFDYLRVDNLQKVKNLFKDFFSFENKAKIMELETTTSANKRVYENLKLKIKDSYES